MENGDKISILSAAQQNLYQPESPVWVGRYQLGLDKHSGKFLLMVQLVNCSSKITRQVFLRVVCFDAERNRLTQLEQIPIWEVPVRPGGSFVADLQIDIPAKETVYAEVYAQRVLFENGDVWEETDPESYIAFRREAVSLDAPDCAALAVRASNGGVRNDYYFRAQKELWLCTCGTPNPAQRQRCIRCGADRLWLEQNMNSELLRRSAFAAHVDTPSEASAFDHPAPSLTVLPAEFSETTRLMAVSPPRKPAPKPEPTLEEEQARAEEQKQEEESVSRKKKLARIIGIITAAVLLIVICIDALLMPHLRYQNALRKQTEGDYDQAIFLFTALGDYRDSQDRVRQSRNEKVKAMMNQGRYQEALNLLESEDPDNPLVADCIYALGVLAYNDGDIKVCLQYTDWLREHFPDYDKAVALEAYCYYTEGSGYESQAGSTSNPSRKIAYYEEAINYYTMAGNYGDAENKLTECRYRLARAFEADWDLLEAYNLYTELGDYQDSADRRLSLMYSYVELFIKTRDPLVYEFLDELVANDVAGAQALQDQLNELDSYSFELIYGASQKPLPAPITDLSDVFIGYKIPLLNGKAPAQIQVVCVLPDGQEQSAVLNPDGSASGVVGWNGLSFPSSCKTGGEVTLVFCTPDENGFLEATTSLSIQYAPSDSDTSGNTDPGDLTP
ncbi:MAG: hypothetical protein J5789_04595 [Oscillospiraceae bacterium]|nr:hypothetical protein [Oscillospiraceae bacterium]